MIIYLNYYKNNLISLNNKAGVIPLLLLAVLYNIQVILLNNN